MNPRPAEERAPGPAVDRELLTGFLVEAWDILAGLEAGISGLTGPAADRARDMLLLFSHRLGGSAALYGLPEVSALGGAIDEVVRAGGSLPWAADEPRIGFLDRALDALREALESLGSSGEEPRGLLARLRSQSASSQPSPSTEEEGRSARLVSDLNRFAQANAEVLEYFGPEAEETLEAISTALDALRREDGSATGQPAEEITALFRSVHTLKGAAYTVGAGPIGDLSHRLEDLLVDLREGRRALEPALLRVLERGAEVLRWMLRAAHGESSPALARQLEMALDRLDESSSELESGSGGALPTLAPDVPDTSDTPVETFASGKPGPSREGSPAQARTTIRVQLDRLDQLMNLVGELVISRGRVERRVERLAEVEDLLASSRRRMRQTVGEFNEKYLDPHLREGEPSRSERASAVVASESSGNGLGLSRFPRGGWAEAFGELEFDRYDDFNILARRIGELSSDLEEVSKELARELGVLRDDVARIQQLTRELRTSISRARMVPVGQLFARFTRVARSVADETGKLVSLELSGEGVEVDNLIIEQIADPLLHLVQNAVIHGIESEAEREAAGKSRQGRIELRATSRGRSIVIEVTDDGRGIDHEALRRHAVDRGFLDRAEAERRDEHELLDLVFLPGFSTSREVTAKAGRGVGLDVVRSNLARLGGEIEIETELGQGTTFRLRLPLTLMVSEALLVRLGEQRYAFPVSAVTGMLSASLGAADEDGETVEVEGAEVPLVHLGRLLGTTTGEDGKELPASSLTPVVVVRAAGRRLALAVDELIEIREVVIKGLGDFLSEHSLISGATVSAEGEVILVLNPMLVARSGQMPAVTSHAVASGWVRDEVAGEASPVVTQREWASVLLVDDSISARKVLGAQLARAGLAVSTAVDGQEAFEKLREASFDVLVTDLEMPRINGYELIEEIRRRPDTREMAVIVITTRAGNKHRDLARQLGIDSYFTKPVDERLLTERILAAVSPAGAAPTRPHTEAAHLPEIPIAERARRTRHVEQDPAD